MGRFGRKINSAAYLYRLGSTVVDSGPPNQWREVRAFLEERPPELVVATHHHEDHAGNLALIQDHFGARIMAPRESLEPLAGGFPLQPYQLFFWGRPRRSHPEPLQGSIDLPDGGTLEPILLPGHSPDMTCFLDPQRGHLYSADLYVSRRIRYLRADEDLGGILDSLEKVLAYDFDTLLCGHRGVVEDAKAKLVEKLDYLRSLCARAAELRDRGWPVRRITRRLLGREDSVSMLCLGHFSKRNLVEGCLASESTRRSR